MPDDVLKLVVHMVFQGLKHLHTESHVIHTDELSSRGYRRVDAKRNRSKRRQHPNGPQLPKHPKRRCTRRDNRPSPPETRRHRRALTNDISPPKFIRINSGNRNTSNHRFRTSSSWQRTEVSLLSHSAGSLICVRGRAQDRVEL